MSSTTTKQTIAQRGIIITPSFDDQGRVRDAFWVPTDNELEARIRLKGHLAETRGRKPGRINTTILQTDVPYRDNTERLELRDD